MKNFKKINSITRKCYCNIEIKSIVKQILNKLIISNKLKKFTRANQFVSLKMIII